jgi:hypothetical protein
LQSSAVGTIVRAIDAAPPITAIGWITSDHMGGIDQH